MSRQRDKKTANGLCFGTVKGLDEDQATASCFCGDALKRLLVLRLLFLR